MLEDFRIDRFVLTGGTHAKRGQGTQDAALAERVGNLVLLLVSDGVGSESDSQVGSIILTQSVRNAVADSEDQLAELSDKVELGDFAATLVEWLNRDLREQIAASSSLLSGRGHKLLAATLLGCVITPRALVVFGCGDGYFGVNGEIFEISPTEGNRPDLPAYALNGTVKGIPRPEGVGGGLIRPLFVEDPLLIDSAFIATDGADEIVAQLNRREAAVATDGGSCHRGPISELHHRLLTVRHWLASPSDDATIAFAVRGGDLPQCLDREELEMLELQEIGGTRCD